MTTTGSTPGLVCDLAALATEPPASPSRKEPSVLLSVFGGALGTILALAAVAGSLVFVDLRDLRSPDAVTTAARSAAITKVAPAKTLTRETPDLLPPPPALAVRAPVPRHPRHLAPARPHHPAAHRSQPHASDVEVANALARAELASSLL